VTPEPDSLYSMLSDGQSAGKIIQEKVRMAREKTSAFMTDVQEEYRHSDKGVETARAEGRLLPRMAGVYEVFV
jgi:hypothetical protein